MSQWRDQSHQAIEEKECLGRYSGRIWGREQTASWPLEITACVDTVTIKADGKGVEGDAVFLIKARRTPQSAVITSTHCCTTASSTEVSVSS